MARPAAVQQTDFPCAFCFERHRRFPLRAAAACTPRLCSLLAKMSSRVGLTTEFSTLRKGKGADPSLLGADAVAAFGGHRC